MSLAHEYLRRHQLNVLPFNVSFYGHVEGEYVVILGYKNYSVKWNLACPKKDMPKASFYRGKDVRYVVKKFGIQPAITRYNAIPDENTYNHPSDEYYCKFDSYFMDFSQSDRIDWLLIRFVEAYLNEYYYALLRARRVFITKKFFYEEILPEVTQYIQQSNSLKTKWQWWKKNLAPRHYPCEGLI